MAKLINLVRSSTKCTVSLVYSRTDLSELHGTLVQNKDWLDLPRSSPNPPSQEALLVPIDLIRLPAGRALRDQGKFSKHGKYSKIIVGKSYCITTLFFPGETFVSGHYLAKYLVYIFFLFKCSSGLLGVNIFFSFAISLILFRFVQDHCTVIKGATNQAPKVVLLQLTIKDW